MLFVGFLVIASVAKQSHGIKNGDSIIYGQMAELAESGFLLRSCTDVKSVPRVRISLCPPLKAVSLSLIGFQANYPAFSGDL